MDMVFGLQMFRDGTGNWHYIITINDRHFASNSAGNHELTARQRGQRHLTDIRRQFRRCERCGTARRQLHVFEIQHYNARNVGYLAPQVLCLDHVKDKDVRFHSRNCPC